MLELERIKVGQDLDREKLECLLYDLRYQRRDFVERPGEFAPRGLNFDIYPITYRSPVRLEFQADTLIAIRDFSPADGRSMASFDEVFLIPVSLSLENRIHRNAKLYESFEPTDSGDLRRGDYVVHLKYGIGRFLGTKVLQIKGEKKKHLAIEYANREILYFPQGEPLDRYIGGEGRPPKLTRLHGKEWERLKERTRRAVTGVAHEMLELQAKRGLEKGFSSPKDHPWQKQFEEEFPFEETPDQIKATEEIKRDMESPRPMDRLIAGDVGYGKTEVALRAAFKAVTAGGKQAAMLVPTTVLAEQHYVVMKNRMKNFPVTVEVLSRFRSKKDQAAIIAGLKKGSVDIVVGTHRLFSKDVHFKELGLVVIDEEQRFGVRHKEKLKEMRELVDILTLTATPIPRTLYMSLVGVRDMSIINTPPKTRLPIETYVMEYDDNLIRQAFAHEIDRCGQVYFVHNRVQSIDRIHAHLKEILPHVKYAVAHGRMPPEALEKVMQDFLEKEIDCLIATNIIESGIDIPNVNTIIVNRADLFGLADLYQLRGRVGRYHEKRQAYAYFLVPRNWVLSLETEKRLAAIARFTELGSGFKIALEDLEIRGAGNLLGHEQSGFINAVGFDLYCRMLRTAVEEAKK